MAKEFKFSIVMSVYNVEKYIDEAINSLLNQSLDFESNVELILVNDGSTDDSERICLKYKNKYPNNIKLISKENGGLASARNCGLKYVTGEYVNFFDPDDILSKNVLKRVYKFFKKNENEIDFVAIPLMFFGKRKGEHYLNYKFENEGIIDLIEYPECYHLSSASAFFKKDVIKKYNFKEGLPRSEDSLTINKLLLKNKRYGVINGVTYYYRQRYDGDSMVDSSKFKKSYYLGLITDYFLDLINYSIEKEGHVPKFIQHLLLYEFRPLLKISDFPEFLTNEDISEFWEIVYEFLSYIDIDVIKDHLILSENMKKFVVFLKNKKDFRVYNKGNIVKFFSRDNEISKLNNNKIWFDIVKFDKGYMYLSGYFKSLCITDSLSIKVIKTDISNNVKEEYEGTFFEYPNRVPVRFLSYDWVYTYSFDVKIPISKDRITKFDFKVVFSENEYHAIMKGHIKFNYPSHINEFNEYSLNKEGIITYEKNSIYFKPYLFKRHCKYEIKVLKNLLSDRPESFITAFLFRIIYFLLFPLFINKKIWLFSDRPYSADDNARHLFSYSIKQDDGIEKYYCLRKDCPDYKKMLKISKNIIPYGSFKHKVYYAFSDKIVSAFLNDSFKNPFYEHNNLYLGLFTFKDYFLQHGVILHDLSAWIKKYDKDLSLIVTTSELERDSFFSYKYNFDEEIVQILGIPRYDTLNNKEKKSTILFTPTWRDYIEDEDSLINSDYFKSINSFFNNEKLMKILKEYKYKIVFKPHPELWEYLKNDLFDMNEYIIVSDESYQELLNTAALMITDYSSIFFDFAYLKKPIIYYQNSSFDEFHYDKGYFDYETMGFGEIINNEDDLVNKIHQYLENNCQNDEKFIKRSDKFFKFHDKNNRKRVYNWILND